MTKFPPSFLHSLVLTSTLCLPVVQAHFGRAKAACLCSYCCNHHLCYDGGRLGRVKIVTLRVGARAKEAKRGGGGEKNTPLLLTRPIFSPLFEFQHALSRAKHSRTRRKRLHCRLTLCSSTQHQPGHTLNLKMPYDCSGMLVIIREL